MNIDIRKSVKANLKGENLNSLLDVINASATANDDLTLPGLGVLFEVLWLNIDTNKKSDIATIILNGLTK